MGTDTPVDKPSDLETALNIALAALGYFNTEQTDEHWNKQERVLREIEKRMRLSARSAGTRTPEAWIARRLTLDGVPGSYSIKAVALDKATLTERGYDDSEIVPLYCTPHSASERIGDAARYRWLCNKFEMLLQLRDDETIGGELPPLQHVRLRCGIALDEWIDARIKEENATDNATDSRGSHG